MAERMIVVVAGVLREDDRVMLCRRKKDALEGMLWEFPGGKVEAGETPEAALERELKEELDIQVRAVSLMDAVVHPASPYPDSGILLLYYLLALESGSPQKIDVGDIAWSRMEELSHYELAPADALFVQRGSIFAQEI